MFRKLLQLDWVLLLAIFLLFGISLLSLYSIATASGDLSVFIKQSIFVAFGIGIIFFLAFSDYHYFILNSRFLYFATLVVLALVLLVGKEIRGTSGWLGIGQFSLQPVEFAKIALVIFLASFISKKKTEFGEIARLFISLILTGIIVLLVMWQPDFGSAMVLIGVWLGMILVSGLNKKVLVLLFATLCIIAASSWFLFADYQKDRITNFLQPESDIRGSGYNVHQSIVAIGSGGINGKGVGHGSQSQLNFLPEKHTDFIFAVITEELGLVGAVAVLALYGIIFYRLRKIAVMASDNFAYLLTSGLIVMLFIQVVVNIGMNVGMFPVAGITLPFLSFGGSSLISLCIAIGIMHNIYIKRDTLESHVVQSY